MFTYTRKTLDIQTTKEEKEEEQEEKESERFMEKV